MHRASLELMAEMLERWQGEANALDVGSLDVNGTFRPLVEGRGWRYTGLDIVSGLNVDIVTPDPFHFPLDDGAYDVVLSGSTMEHVTAFWLWLPELVRVLRPGGLLAIHTHWQMVEHRYPVDCWRFLPDGMHYLFDSVRMLHSYDIRIANEIDIIASAFKREQ